MTATPVRLDATRAGETDTRGLNFTNVLAPGDMLASVTSVTVARRDSVTIGASDLTITPAGAVSPWVESSSTGIVDVVIGWWQNSGPSIAGTGAAPTPIDYQGTAKVVTTLGRTIVRDFYIMVVPGLG